MAISSPDILTFKQNLDSAIIAIENHSLDSHSAIKIQSLLNITLYALASRFLEGSIKHIVYNCCIMRGDNATDMNTLESRLKGFNNPEYSEIRKLFLEELNFDIVNGMNNGHFIARDITFLNEIIRNRHRNVHASNDPSKWYNSNTKNVINFNQEYVGLINILEYLSNLRFDVATTTLSYNISQANAQTNSTAPINTEHTSNIPNSDSNQNIGHFARLVNWFKKVTATNK